MLIAPVAGGIHGVAGSIPVSRSKIHAASHALSGLAALRLGIRVALTTLRRRDSGSGFLQRVVEFEESTWAGGTVHNLSHFALLLLFTLAAGLGPVAADASTVKVLRSTLAGTIANADADDDLDAFYNGVGATSSLHTGTLTAPDLVGVDLLVLMLPDDAFSPSEIAVIDDFVAAGGELLLIQSGALN